MSGTRVAAPSLVLGRASLEAAPGRARTLRRNSSACPPAPCPKERLLPGVQVLRSRTLGRCHLGPQTLKGRVFTPALAPDSLWPPLERGTWGDRGEAEGHAVCREGHTAGQLTTGGAGLKSRPEMGKDAQAACSHSCLLQLEGASQPAMCGTGRSEWPLSPEHPNTKRILRGVLGGAGHKSPAV